MEDRLKAPQNVSYFSRLTTLFVTTCTQTHPRRNTQSRLYLLYPLMITITLITVGPEAVFYLLFFIFLVVLSYAAGTSVMFTLICTQNNKHRVSSFFVCVFSMLTLVMFAYQLGASGYYFLSLGGVLYDRNL
ncbi:hypothetical protein F5X99DRAFT_384431 [Biscogniauxia marginata]|nr:hypothetical protein F5X99DRAFT_384431 [Biscogniauxia marginata]